MNIGSRLQNRYRILKQLGKGGMGAVYLAEDANLSGRQVAIKVNQDTSSSVQEQFKREAALLARLRHPNLPQVHDFFLDALGRQYLVMEYVEGDDLQEAIARNNGPLPLAEVLAAVEQVMQALAYMHGWRDPVSQTQRAIIHRDIKPANLKRTPEGRVVLVDFGIAKFGGEGNTANSARAFTPGYAPIEQYHGGTDARSDIYALGATFYALLTGHAPPSATSMMSGGTLSVPQQTKQPIPRRYEQVIRRAMKMRPEDRWQTIAEMYRATYDRPLTPSSNPPVSVPVQPKERSDRLTVIGMGIGVVAVLIVAGAIGLFLTSGGSGQPTAPVTATAVTAPVTPPDVQAAADLKPAIAADAPVDATATSEISATPGVTPQHAEAVATDVQTPPVAAASSTPSQPAANTQVQAATTPTARPTSTPLTLPSPTATALPATPIVRVTAPPSPSSPTATTAAPAVPASPTGNGPTAIRVLEPGDGRSSNAPLNFAWESDAILGIGQVYELVFWPADQSREQGRALTAASTATVVRIDPTVLLPGNYRWGVYLASQEPFRRLDYLGAGYLFVVTSGDRETDSKPSENPSTIPDRPGD